MYFVNWQWTQMRLRHNITLLTKLKHVTRALLDREMTYSILIVLEYLDEELEEKEKFFLLRLTCRLG